MKKKIGPNGSIERVSPSRHIVRVVGKEYLLGVPGVTCENPDASEDERVYCKVFVRKRIYMPNEYDKAVREVLGGQGVIVLGMTGYSDIGATKIKAWGIEPGEYEAACADMLGHFVNILHGQFPGVRIKIVHGAANMGVDRAAIEVAKYGNIDNLGFNCPEYMFYVEDDDGIVYVAESKSAYAEAFIKSLDILISIGGRMHALEHDILASIKYNKRLILIDVLGAIAQNGVPARDADGKVEDATSAFMSAVPQLGYVFERSLGGDRYQIMRDFFAQLIVSVAREILPPERAYALWRNGR